MSTQTKQQAEREATSAWSAWSASDIAGEIRNRMNHFYRQTNGSMRFPNSAEGDLLKMTHALLEKMGEPVAGATPPAPEERCYVVRKRGLFYRPNDCGYTNCLEKAGRYTYAEAKEREYPHDEPVTMHHVSEFLKP